MKRTINTGLEGIDNKFGGLRSGEVTLIGGRPSMGKTSLVLQIALNAAKAGKNVLFFTAGLSPVELELKLTSIISGIDMSKIRQWNMNDDEWNLFRGTIGDVKELPIHFVHTNTIQMIKLMCADKNNAADLVIFDYLQLVHLEYAETEKCTQDLTCLDYLKEFRKLAKKHNVPAVVLSQLSRRLEKRKDKHPRVADFRIDNLTDADYDQAFLLYREGYYDYDAPRDTAELTGICPKKKLKETMKLKWNYDKGIFE